MPQWGSHCSCLCPSCRDAFLIFHDLIYKSVCVALEWGSPTPGEPSPSFLLVLPLPPSLRPPTSSCFDQVGVCPCIGPFRKYRKHTYVYLQTLSLALPGHCPAPNFVHLTLSACHCDGSLALSFPPSRGHVQSPLMGTWEFSVFAVTMDDHSECLPCMSYVSQPALGMDS